MWFMPLDKELPIEYMQMYICWGHDFYSHVYQSDQLWKGLKLYSRQQTMLGVLAVDLLLDTFLG